MARPALCWVIRAYGMCVASRTARRTYMCCHVCGMFVRTWGLQVPSPVGVSDYLRRSLAGSSHQCVAGTPYVCGDIAREIGRWALFMGGPWPPKQGRGPVAIKARHARRIRGKKVLWLDWAAIQFRVFRPSSFNTALQLVLRPYFLVHFV
jgi:hypothetical protein